ncbi:vacuole membrane protein 1-like isoform X2 [Ctenocephalides felis]|uniref:vacuole membrane protein 1-like isoform X2 n=1 Tax=Ctenocephalides felis TaxID=7515 RepID=UPI000E6E53A6|nr:vacuole membrane protein 1-like isoform X2 [Ctenocephalides felis]
MEQLIDLPNGGDCCISIMADIGEDAQELQRLGHKMSTGSNSSQHRSPKSSAINTPLQKNGDAVHTKPTHNPSANAGQRDKHKAEREGLVLWRRPFTTLKYSTLESWMLLQTYGRKVREYKKTVVFLISLLLVMTALCRIQGPHQEWVALIRSNVWWVVYWTGLGVLSSVGLGTGLHTFLLYLGPHIAAVTIAAYECGALNFPEPPYPEDIICPTEPNPRMAASIWNIMSKVRVEAFLWGAGTALGELPPYFMARAARLSGYDPSDADDLAEFEELQRKKSEGTSLSLVDRAKLEVERLVEKVGFFGILACASIPNPLFDLAGITCGHFLVPFWTFFGATLIGKAIIKMHIQKVFVIIAFNEALIEKAVQLLELVPIVGMKLQEPFKKFLENQKTRMHRKSSSSSPPVESGNLLAYIFEKVVILMILYFVISIVNSLAQSYHKRIHKRSGPRRKIARD